MVLFFKFMLTVVHTMWLKICYVLKNNKDKLLGYIHVPTKQDNFTEEIRWVPARKNDATNGKLRCVTPDLDLDSLCNDENNSPFDKGDILTYHEIDDIVCGNTGDEDIREGVEACDIDDDSCSQQNSPTHETFNEHIPSPIGSDFTEKVSVVNDDEDFNMKTLSLSDDSIAKEQIPSPTDMENRNNDSPPPAKELTVEIRYKPKTRKSKSSHRKLKKTNEEREVLSSINNVQEDNDKEDEIDEDNIEEDSRFADLEQMSFNNKIRFIYSRRDDDTEDIFRVPSRQEDFNVGIRNYSSSPKKEQSHTKRAKYMKTSSRNDATFSMPSNSSELKEIIYHQWLDRKKRQARKDAKLKALSEKKAARQAETETKTRKLAADTLYDAWNTSKTEEIVGDKEAKKKKAKQTEKEKLETSLQRQRDAEKYFKAWKREKDENMRKLKSQKRKEEKEKSRELCKQRRESSEEALKAFSTWKVQKAKEQTETKKKEEEVKAKNGEEKLRAFEKKQEALRIYDQWRGSVKNSPRSPSPQVNQGAWLPPGRNVKKAISDDVNPTTVRNRDVAR